MSTTPYGWCRGVARIVPLPRTTRSCAEHFRQVRQRTCSQTGRTIPLVSEIFDRSTVHPARSDSHLPVAVTMMSVRTFSRRIRDRVRDRQTDRSGSLLGPDDPDSVWPFYA